MREQPDDFLRAVDARAFGVPCRLPADAFVTEYLPDGTVGAVFREDGRVRQIDAVIVAEAFVTLFDLPDFRGDFFRALAAALPGTFASAVQFAPQIDATVGVHGEPVHGIRRGVSPVHRFPDRP